ncbi:MAG: hypothetical protein L6R38_002419 [Xanthoria sp. 2 TBL-2021]|nr:MAG: hypothetical protein L6R38_002419 [Xanthoria sp. 2 TBL-2021]
MTELPEQQNVFNGILQVLQRIEANLETHELRVKHVEDLIRTHRSESTESQDISSSSSKASSAPSWHQSLDTGPIFRTRNSNPLGNATFDAKDHREKDGEAFSTYSRAGPRFIYSLWRSDQGKEDPTDMLDESHRGLLRKFLGSCSVMPDDGRLPLSFSWSTSNVRRRSITLENPLGYQIAAPRTLQLVDNLAEARRLDALRTFDTDLRSLPGNDFLVVDVDSSNSSRLYRIGQDAIGGELMVRSEPSHDAPWSRLILYQGMTTGNSIKPEFDTGFADPIPYFKRADTSTGLWNHIFSHLQLKRRSDSSNPYAKGHLGFHTTFYDIRETKDLEAKEVWKHGPLYDDPLGRHFRKCAYTLYCPVPMDEDGDTERNFEMTRPHWTMLVLAPGGFFDEHNTSFPMKSIPKGRAQALGHCLGRLTRAGAELNLIAQGLARISERWADFQSFFDYILDSGDSLMQPNEHDNLLFDDGSFSRSRRYFWAIDCLSEFDTTITDNINQWELYKAALPVLDNELDSIQLRNAERQCRILQNQREHFRQKLASTRALRDALFNASAVIESRASTRLGENVKLLTFVSVFFIPLSFCTSLWSVNDMFSMNSLIAVIVIVAFLTYTTVLNINSIVTTVGLLYDTKKRRVVNAMKRDSRDSWKHCGQRFESFRPKHENPKPSEWYITLYALLNPMAVLGLPQRKTYVSREDQPKGKSTERFFGIPTRIWRRRMDQAEETEQPEEAWVVGYRPNAV